jgi:hypothetical protein
MRPSANELLTACEQFNKAEKAADNYALDIVGLGRKDLAKDSIGEKRWLEHEALFFRGYKDEECVHIVLRSHRLWALANYLGRKGYDVIEPRCYDYSPGYILAFWMMGKD